MKKINSCFIFLLGLAICVGYTATKEISPMDIISHIHWLGQSAVKIDAPGKVIYIDPYRLKGGDRADLILITHAHSDHFSPPDINKILSEGTIVIAPQDCLQQIKNLESEKTVVLKPGMKKQFGDILIEAVPAYNVVKTSFHPRANQWVGYVITIQGIRIYHAGDTERIPEMKDVRCDIAMLPLGQTYTMNSIQEAADAALDIKPKVVIPIHYGMYEGSQQDALLLHKLLKDRIRVIIKNQE